MPALRKYLADGHNMNDALAFTGFEFEVAEEAENNVILLRKSGIDGTFV